MAQDRTIAPGSARWRRAWQAGLRPRSRWLLPAVACALLAAALDGGPVDPRAWGLDVSPGALEPRAWLGAVARSLGVVWGLAGLVVVGVALLSVRLGGISRPAQRRLGAAPSSPAVVLALGLGALVGLLVALTLLGVLAGAARSVDASEAGLVVLWWSWAARGAATLAVGLSLAALGELVLDRRSRLGRLLQSREQVRADARASGAR